MRSSRGCNSNWTISDPKISLVTVSVTAVQQTIPPSRTTVVELYLLPNSLSPHHQYSFTFRCGQLTAAITVVTNSPPANGFFHVLPKAGYQITTLYNFSAGSWIDKDLPLLYQFSYLDGVSGAVMVVRDEALTPNASSFLPVGLSARGYEVNCSVFVFDALSASTTQTSAVYVFQTPQSALNSFISSHLNSTSTGTINLITTVLNKVNCSGVRDCDHLNRLDCSTVDFTCGPCKTGYIGQSGADNSMCLSSSSFISSPPTTSKVCHLDSDCPPFQSCNVSSHSCFLPSKSCPNSCSSQGSCQFVNINNRIQVGSCKISAVDCEAVCVCNKGFSGSSCSLTTQQLAEKQQQRAQLLASFSSTSVANVTSQTILARASTLLSITQNSDEIGSSSISVALSSANSLLQRANALSVDYLQLGGLLESADRVATAAQDGNHSSTLLSTIESFSALVSQQIVTGQKVENVLSTFRATTTSLPKSSTNISVPLLALEQLQSSARSSVHFEQNTSSTITATMSLIEANAKLFGNHLPYSSNPLTIKISDVRSLNYVNSTPGSHEVIVNLSNFVPSTITTSVNFTTTCNQFMKHSVLNFTCPGSGHVIVHNCSNKVGILRSFCPVYRPSCTLMSSKQTTECRAINYTESTTTCRCTISVLTNKRRLQSSSDGFSSAQAGAFQLATLTELVASDFVNTFSAAPSLTSTENIDKSLTVIVMFTGLWGGAIILMLLCNWRRQESNFLKSKKDTSSVSPARVDDANLSP